MAFVVGMRKIVGTAVRVKGDILVVVALASVPIVDCVFGTTLMSYLA
jgi:hypothetical protein